MITAPFSALDGQPFAKGDALRLPRYCAAAKQVRAEAVKAGDRIYVQSSMGFVAKVLKCSPPSDSPLLHRTAALSVPAY